MINSRFVSVSVCMDVCVCVRVHVVPLYFDVVAVASAGHVNYDSIPIHSPVKTNKMKWIFQMCEWKLINPIIIKLDLSVQCARTNAYPFDGMHWFWCVIFRAFHGILFYAHAHQSISRFHWSTKANRTRKLNLQVRGLFGSRCSFTLFTWMARMQLSASRSILYYACLIQFLLLFSGFHACSLSLFLCVCCLFQK